MATWQTFQDEVPELASYAQERLIGAPSYLATIRPDGGPRVHPVTPIIGHGRLFVFMYDTSPKGKDLRRDNRYALHCSVENNSGGNGEVIVQGRAHFVEDARIRQLAVESSTYKPKDVYILFQLDVERVLVTTYEGEARKPVHKRWKTSEI